MRGSSGNSRSGKRTIWTAAVWVSTKASPSLARCSGRRSGSLLLETPPQACPKGSVRCRWEGQNPQHSRALAQQAGGAGISCRCTMMLLSISRTSSSLSSSMKAERVKSLLKQASAQGECLVWTVWRPAARLALPAWRCCSQRLTSEAWQAGWKRV